MFCDTSAYNIKSRYPNEVSRATERKERRLTFSRSMQKSLGNQNSWIATIRSDLEDIRSRLAAVETTMEMVAKEGESDTTKGNATRRTLRSQQ